MKQIRFANPSLVLNGPGCSLPGVHRVVVCGRASGAPCRPQACRRHSSPGKGWATASHCLAVCRSVFRYHQHEHITACPCARHQRRAVCLAGFFTARCFISAAATRVERVCWCKIVPPSSPCLLHLGVGDRRRAHVLAQPAHQLVRPQLAARDAQHRARRPVVPAQLRVLHLVDPVQYSLFAQPPANAHHRAPRPVVRDARSVTYSNSNASTSHALVHPPANFRGNQGPTRLCIYNRATPLVSCKQHLSSLQMALAFEGDQNLLPHLRDAGRAVECTSWRASQVMAGGPISVRTMTKTTV